MNKMTQISLIGSLLITGLTLPASALAGILSKLEAQCQCFTEQATLGQMISLGVMVTLIATIFVVKWVYRKELDQPSKKSEDDNPSKKSEDDNPAIQTLKQLKIGARFSDWTHLNRLTGQKQPAP